MMVDCGQKISPTPDIETMAEIVKMDGGLKKFKCRLCQHISPFYSKFINHYRTHTGEKPFSCPHCPYRGNQKSNLTVHMLNKHKDVLNLII